MYEGRKDGCGKKVESVEREKNKGRKGRRKNGGKT